ncbi:MAG: PD-(D/E)XK nuclease family protein [Nitrospirae bacterium]|nr:PD-(D/E)XK nuclease family protein [Nitrospirota bacterium]
MGELVNEFAWSVSRARTFRDCRRQYYYDVHGMWNGWKEDAPERTRQIYVLSKLMTRAMWMGDLVHEAIKRFLLAMRRKEPMDPAAWRKSTMELMRRDFASSRSKTYWQPGKAKTCALFEHEFGIELSDEKWKETAGMVQDCLVAFEESQAFKSIQKVDPKDWVSLEELIKFQLEGTLILGKMDLAYRTRERRIRILDWKTGKDDVAEIGFQMGAYALAASHLWHATPDGIETFAINLRTRNEEAFPVSAELIANVKGKILASAGEMRALLRDPTKNVAVEDDFPGTTDPSTCRWCPYQRLCPVRV